MATHRRTSKHAHFFSVSIFQYTCDQAVRASSHLGMYSYFYGNVLLGMANHQLSKLMQLYVFPSQSTSFCPVLEPWGRGYIKLKLQYIYRQFFVQVVIHHPTPFIPLFFIPLTFYQFFSELKYRTMRQSNSDAMCQGAPKSAYGA